MIGKLKKRTFPELLTEAYLLALVTVFLLYCGSGGYEQIQHAKTLAFYVLAGGYVVLMGAYGLEGLAVGAVHWESPAALWRKSDWLQRLMAAYLAVTWLSALLSPRFPETVLGATRGEGAVTVTLYVVSFLLISVYGRADKLLLAAFAGGLTVFCLIALLQLQDLNPLGLFPEGVRYSDAGRAYAGAYLGTVGNVDLAAALLCIGIPVLLLAALRGKDPRRLLLWLPIGLSAYVLLRMWVLAGVVGLAGGLLLALPFAFPWGKKGRRGLLLGLGVLLLAGLALVWFADPGAGFLHEAHSLLHGRPDPDFGSGRLHIWRQVLSRIPEHPLLGAGPDTMALAELEPFSRYDPQLGELLVAGIDTAHNQYLNILFHQGAAGLAAYGGALLWGFCRWLRRAPGSPRAAALGSAVLCWCIQDVFGISMCITAPFFWAALGLLDRELRAE